MANVDENGFLAEGFNLQSEEEEMDVEEPAIATHVVNVQSSQSEQEDLGEDIGNDSSSDPPAGQAVPSISSAGEYTVRSVPQPFGQVPLISHIPSSIRDMHINVGMFATAGVRTTSEAAMQSLLCSAHPTSWQPGCAVCDLPLVHTSKEPVYAPKMAVADRLLGRIAKPPTHAVELGVVGLEVARHVCNQQKPMAAKGSHHGRKATYLRTLSVWGGDPPL